MIFKGKVAVITGGSSGIGLALGDQLAKAGAHVWLIARDKVRLSAALISLKAAGSAEGQKHGVCSVDVSSYTEVEQAFADIQSQVGVPDILINSAGVVHPGRFIDLDLEKFHWMIDINYFGSLHTIKAVLPGMLERGSGSIVNISSGAGFVGIYGYTAYAGSKFALRGMTDALRCEVKPEGISVSIVFPPDTDTPQLAYENQFKPPETKFIANAANAMSAEKVAAAILKGVERKKYLILPGDTKFLFRLQNLLGGNVYPILDKLIKQARKKTKSA